MKTSKKMRMRVKFGNFILFILFRNAFSERQRCLLTEMNELHSSLIKNNDQIREYLQTDI